MAKITETSTDIEIAQTIIDNLQSSGVNLELDSTDNSKVVVSADSTRELTTSEKESVSKFQPEIASEITSKIDTTTKGEEPKRIFRISSISDDAGIEILQGKEGSQGVASINGSTGNITVVNSVCGKTGDVVDVVCSWNGQTGTVVFTDYVSSFNGVSGAISGVNSVNGLTGTVTLTDLVGVNTFNGLSGDIDTSSLVLTVAGLSAGTSVQTMNGLVINQGNSGDATSIAIGGTAINGAPLSSDVNSGIGGNIAIGNGVLSANTTGHWNVGIGYGALKNSTTKDGNVAVGQQALSSSGGTGNVGVGKRAFYAGIGSQNVAIGDEALYNAGTKKSSSLISDYNVAVGACAGHGLSHGINNIFIGYDTRPTASEISNQIAIGNTSSAYLYTAAGISAGGATFGGDVNFLGNAIVATGGYLQWPDGTTQGTTPIQRFYANTFIENTSPYYDEFELISNSGDIAITTLGTSLGSSNRIKYIFALGTNIPKLDGQNTFTNTNGNVFETPVGSNRYAGNNSTETVLAATDHASATYMGVTSGTVNFKILGTDILDMDSDIHAYVGISADAGATFGGNVVVQGGISANAGISTAGSIQFSDGSVASSYTDTIGVYVSNGTSTITTGIKGRRVIPYDCEVVEWIVTGSTSGSITWDINWGKTSAWPNALASVGFSGNGSAPQLGTTASQSYVLIPTAWTKSGFSAGDIIQFEIDSVSKITDCELALKIRRTL